jgi:hypothetical protein
MDSVNEFFKIEITSVTKKRILDLIDGMRNNISDSEETEMTFNVYSLVLSKQTNEVQIYNDIIPEIPVVCMSMDDFYSMLNQSGVW